MNVNVCNRNALTLNLCCTKVFYLYQPFFHIQRCEKLIFSPGLMILILLPQHCVTFLSFAVSPLPVTQGLFTNLSLAPTQTQAISSQRAARETVMCKENLCLIRPLLPVPFVFCRMFWSNCHLYFLISL